MSRINEELLDTLREISDESMEEDWFEELGINDPSNFRKHGEEDWGFAPSTEDIEFEMEEDELLINRY